MGTLAQPATGSSPFAASRETPPLRLLERRPSARRTDDTVRPQPVASPDWLSRLAAWAEAQPVHRRFGSWTRLP
jgi:hypothetical protein